MRDFSSKAWTDEIAELSTLPEFQNASIEIWDPSITGTYDVVTGEWTHPEDEDPILYEGRARVRDLRWGVFSGGEAQFNTKSLSTIRVQVPKNAVGRLPAGASVIVRECDDHPALVGVIFAVTDGFQGGAQAARTFEASVDSDAELVEPVEPDAELEG